MNWYEKIREYYAKGYYDSLILLRYVELGKLTREQCNEIQTAKATV